MKRSEKCHDSLSTSKPQPLQSTGNLSLAEMPQCVGPGLGWEFMTFGLHWLLRFHKCYSTLSQYYVTSSQSMEDIMTTCISSDYYPWRLINADSRRSPSGMGNVPRAGIPMRLMQMAVLTSVPISLGEFNLEQRERFVSPVASFSEAHPYLSSLFLKFTGQFYSTVIPAWMCKGVCYKQCLVWHCLCWGIVSHHLTV